ISCAARCFQQCQAAIVRPQGTEPQIKFCVLGRRASGPAAMTHATTVSFDAGRMRRYDREGPRYTSYPTAQQFADGISPNEYAQAAAGSRGAREGQPLSVYIHIPFCASPCFYCGCNKIITRQM